MSQQDGSPWENAAVKFLRFRYTLSGRLLLCGQSVFDRCSSLSDTLNTVFRTSMTRLERVLDDNALRVEALEGTTDTGFDQLVTTKGLGYGLGYAIAHDSLVSLLRFRLRKGKLELAAMRYVNDGMLLSSQIGCACMSYGLVDARRTNSRAEALKQIFTDGESSIRPYELLVWLATHPDDVEEHIGDLLESFNNRRQKLGDYRARAWFRRKSIEIAWERAKGFVAAVTFVTTVVRFLEARHRR